MKKKEEDCGVCGEGKVPDQDGNCSLPEVTFSAFVMSLNTSVLYHLGEISDPETGRKTIDLSLAKHGIDTLTVVEKKTKGNLDKDEEGILQNVLYDLKIRFIKAVKK